MYVFPNDDKKEGEGKNRKGEGGEEEEDILESLSLKFSFGIQQQKYKLKLKILSQHSSLSDFRWGQNSYLYKRIYVDTWASPVAHW